ncbi:MAG: histidine--tRNA ligase [Clostridiales bacterium]|nr:histidine--tRNA ligase [Clostridiales bacterium]
MINIPKGTKDVLPSEVYLWQHVEKTARETAAGFGFREIRTPVFEHTELFLRGVGDTTDIVNKEMYTFLDKGGRSITLRPEGTAGVARAFLEGGLAGGVLPAKMYYLISAFRYERPQAGRLREFHQFGAELYGSASPYADAETIALADTFLKNLGLKAVTLKLNSIGCKHCRTEYHKALKEYFAPHLHEMCEDCRARYEKNPMRMIDCKEERCKVYTAHAPRMLDYLCNDCKAHFETVRELLDEAKIAYTIDPSIVRGLDYYSRTVFEFASAAAGAQGTVLGGGRYDTLLEQMGEKPIPAVGFAVGIERLLMVIAAENAPVPNEERPAVYLLGMDAQSRKKAYLLATQLRTENISCEVDLMERSVKAQFKYADKLGARFTVVIGESECAAGAAEVKDMKNSSSERVEFARLAQYIKERL